MKKFFVLLVTVFFLFSPTTETKAQEGRPTQGDIIVHMGAGFGAFSLLYYKPRPLINFGVEYMAVDDIAGIGSLGIGATVGLKRYRYDFLDDYSFSRVFIAPRAVVHFDVGNDEFDLYAGLQMGVSFWVDSETDGSFDAPSSISIDPGFVAGGNYYLTDSFGFFGELSYSMARFNLGLALKF